MKGDFTDKLLKSGLKVDPPTDVNPEALTQLGALLTNIKSYDRISNQVH